MIVLDYRENGLIIDLDSENALKKHQCFQLIVSYGFQYTPNHSSLITSKEVSTFLPNLIAYLQEEKVHYELSDNCHKTNQEIIRKKNEIRHFIETARTYKDGTFNKKDFNEHLAFLKKNVKRELRDHQIKAFYHLSKIGNGANFSVPGSGKTTVVLSVFEKLRIEGEINLLFVIGPPSCFGPWKKEFKEVLGREPIYSVLAGGNKTWRKEKYYETISLSELYLTTFQTLFRDKQEVIAFLQNTKVRAFVVIDEAHYIKQLDGIWASTVLEIAQFAKKRCVLTGTPIPNGYSDLFNLFDFLWPEKNIVTDEEKGRLQMFEDKKDLTGASAILDPLIGPLFYRVRKRELGLKPQVFIDPIKVEMKENERRLYNAILGKIRQCESEEQYLKDASSDLVTNLRKGRMMRLRQVLSYPKLILTAIDNYSENILRDREDLEVLIQTYDQIEQPGKIDSLLSLVKKFNEQSEKVVIWANFIGTINLIEDVLKKNGYYCKKIYGATPFTDELNRAEETREKIRDEFVDPRSGLDILIANPAACSESISLHKTCSNALYYDLSYNCAQYLQSLDRIHRVGGSEEKEAFYYFLQYANTIEPKLLITLNTKAHKMYQIIEGDYSIYSLDMYQDDELDIAIYSELFKK